MTWVRRAAAVLLVPLVLNLAHADDALRVFGVRDSIARQRFVPIEVARETGRKYVVDAPDGSRFLVLTQSGNLEKNAIIEKLLLFEGRDVEDYLLSGNGGERPEPHVIWQREIVRTLPHAEVGIRSLRWLGNLDVGFIAADGNGVNQIFEVNVESGGASQLTHSASDVTAFDVSKNLIVYWAVVPADIEDVIQVEDRSLFDLLQANNAAVPTLRLFQQSRSSGAARLIDQQPVRLATYSQNIWISPDQAYAVTFTPSVNAPGHWSEYVIRSDELADYFIYEPSKVTSDPTSATLTDRTRYQLVNLRSGRARPLLDAPTGLGFYPLGARRAPFAVSWPAGGRSVIVTNTFLPLATEDSKERERRRRFPAVAQVDLKTGEVTPIVSMNKHSPGKRNIQVENREGLNTRSKLYAVGGVCGCAKELFDPWPQADRYRFGRMEPFEWTDRNSIRWRGGLLTPPDYVAGRRYPVVVQTHGFEQDEFLIDGPHGSTTAMAAQALAAAGLVVLQIEDNQQAMTLDETEPSLYAEGYRAGIRSLIERGITDERKVGLIAFSRTGLSTIRLIADQPDLLAAVTIADASWWGYLNDLKLTNVKNAYGIRRVTGGSPRVAELTEWMARNPLYRLPYSRAAIRLEANGGAGALSLLGHWEHFALLRKENRPVDLVYFPKGNHVLEWPSERLASQGGNVDWFRFWLQGYEDRAPDKRRQYERWRVLRGNL